MRTLVGALLFWMLASVVAYGQPISGSAYDALGEMQRSLEGYKAFRRDCAESLEKLREAERDLFGTEGMDTENGVVPKAVLRVGNWGLTRRPFRVLDKVSDTECLVIAQRYYDEELRRRWPKQTRRRSAALPEDGASPGDVFLLRGLDMSKVVDGIEFAFADRSSGRPFVIQDTFTYTTTSGAKKAVAVLDFDEGKVRQRVEQAKEEAEEAEREAREAAEAARYRTFTDHTGKFSVEAEFLDFKDGEAILNCLPNQPDSSYLERSEEVYELAVPMLRLSEEDQAWIREELRRRREEDRDE